MKAEKKRVFFAFEVASPWPKKLPPGRTLEPSGRHLTIVFLGDIHYPDLEKILSTFPSPQIKVGLAGKFDRCLFLPPKRPNVVAWHVTWFDTEYDLGLYQKEMADWLTSHDFSVRLNPRGFLPHVTLSRRPFKHNEWRETFFPLPVVIKDIHLYESLGGLKYGPVWSHPLPAPFERKEDSRLIIRGESPTQLLRHGFTAVAFEYPDILQAYKEDVFIEEAKAVPSTLNELLDPMRGSIPLPVQEVETLSTPTETEEGVWTWHARLKIKIQ